MFPLALVPPSPKELRHGIRRLGPQPAYPCTASPRRVSWRRATVFFNLENGGKTAFSKAAKYKDSPKEGQYSPIESGYCRTATGKPPCPRKTQPRRHPHRSAQGVEDGLSTFAGPAGGASDGEAGSVGAGAGSAEGGIAVGSGFWAISSGESFCAASTSSGFIRDFRWSRRLIASSSPCSAASRYQASALTSFSACCSRTRRGCPFPVGQRRCRVRPPGASARAMTNPALP